MVWEGGGRHPNESRQLGRSKEGEGRVAGPALGRAAAARVPPGMGGQTTFANGWAWLWGEAG